jgi:MFS family permease
LQKTNFRELFAAPGVLKVLISQLYGRFPFGMLSLAFIIHIQAVTGSFAIAGIALGAETIGASISGPILGRWMAVFGVRKVIGVATVITSSAMLAMAWVPPEPLLLILLAFLVGLSSPPIQPAARTIYPQITPKRHLGGLYSLDATAQEIIWVVGPLVATLVAAQFGNLMMIYVMVMVQLTGSAWFISLQVVHTASFPRTDARLGRVLKNPTVALVTVLGLLLVGSFAGVEVGAVALFDKAVVGAVIAVFSVGSFIGGFTLGALPRGRWSLTWFVGLVLFGYSLAMLNPTSALWMGFSLFISGLGVAPALGTLALWVAQGTKSNETSEAYGWVTTGQLVGFSAGSALAGIAIDAVTPEAALLVSVVFGLATLLAAALTSHLSAKFLVT